MKIPALVVAAMAASVPSTGAFSPRPFLPKTLSMSTSTQHYATTPSDTAAAWGSLMAGVAGWTLASQAAWAGVAGNTEVNTVPAPPSPIEIVQDDAGINPARSSLLLSGSYDTLDFSMPSYGEGAADAPKSKFSTPSFNPFGDFEPAIVTGSDPAPAPAPAAVAEEPEVKKTDDKASRAAQKAEEKAAAEAAKAEKEAAAAAKKAEKEARLAAEKEKQKAAVERQKETAAAPAAAAAAGAAFEMPDFKAPELPDFKAPEMPDFKAPDIKIPDFKAPDFKAPDMSSFKAPDMPDFKAPDGFKAPDFKAPDMPKFSMPKIDMPAMPAVSKSEYNLDIPKFDTPKVSAPSLPNPFGGGGSKTAAPDDENIPPQEERDESARAARREYLEADQLAKEAESAARKVRDAANDKKREASFAKDEACKTRPGGKLLCLRNPFSSGF